MNIKHVKNIKQNDGYYFPLFNIKGLKSSITPFFAGDLKTDHHHYALSPSTEVDLFDLTHTRQIRFDIDGQTFLINGQTAHQQDDDIIYETDLLYQKVTRIHPTCTIEVTSFIPLDATIELHRVTLKNTTSQAVNVDIHTAIQIYGRSADNLRDHRHVTSLLNQIEIKKNTICVQPTLSFDERGHQVNHTVYSVSALSPQLIVKGYIPTLDRYLSGGSLAYPKGLYNVMAEGERIEGYEGFGGIFFDTITLKPDEAITLYLSIGIHEDTNEALDEHQTYMESNAFDRALDDVKTYFKNYIQSLSFKFGDLETSKQLGWVMLQPMLRRFFGNSYMPHHDYGRGGRGWRDLWQDCLALIMTNDPSVLDLLINNFAGVRIDGTNATIIGDKPGEFKADRNQITRVWSDHGAWPLLTLKMYIDETGDLDVLFVKQSYFKDQYTHYTKKTQTTQGATKLSLPNGTVYQGTILEHLLIQNLVGHHNIGDHGYVRLEDADWNDGLDMAHHKGETIPFTHMYANNLKVIADLVEASSQSAFTLYEGISGLLEADADLTAYFDDAMFFNGNQISYDKRQLTQKLRALAEQRIKHLHDQAFMDTHYASYYDDDGKLLDTNDTVNLTGQTMALLNETATPKQAASIAIQTKKALFSPNQGGYLLNSNYGEVLTKLGRAFGFAYGHKENGAMFSHMAVMYAYGLYQYDLIDYGHEAIMALLKRAQHPDAKVWVGIPEYFSDQGVGKYSYLTGSASWLLKLMRTEVFGIHFKLGQLALKPKLKSSDFIHGQASIKTYISGQLITVTYHNPKSLEYGQYAIHKILMNHQVVTQPIHKIMGDIEVYLDETV